MSETEPAAAHEPDAEEEQESHPEPQAEPSPTHPDRASKKEAMQAVVLIHGIGEQRPMDTLRSFVRAVWETDEAVRYPGRYDGVWSKPDKASGSYELRRLTTGQNRNRVRTDFFELYWAHLMEGNAFNHVVAWLRMLLLRRPGTVPRHLQPLWWLLVVSVVAAGAFAVWGAVNKDASLLGLHPALAGLLTAAVSGVIGSFVVFWVGDAARYLNASPPNIKSRAAIRKAGVDLLRTLHDRDKYERIIIVGHSLGSVVGYDILTHAWPEFNERHDGRERPNRPKLREFELYLAQRVDRDGKVLRRDQLEPGIDPLDPARCRELQAACHAELRETGSRWLVSDFVTLGSPLAHAAALLARSPADLDAKIAARELPSCPPALEDPHRNTQPIKRRFSWRLKYRVHAAARGGRSVFVPHHAAVFCPTRWTNLYFPRRWLFWGDLVGGEVAPVFGPAIDDVPVKSDRWFGLFSHTSYWWLPKRREPDATPHIVALRRALNLLDR